MFRTGLCLRRKGVGQNTKAMLVATCTAWRGEHVGQLRRNPRRLGWKYLYMAPYCLLRTGTRYLSANGSSCSMVRVLPLFGDDLVRYKYEHVSVVSVVVDANVRRRRWQSKARVRRCRAVLYCRRRRWEFGGALPKVENSPANRSSPPPSLMGPLLPRQPPGVDKPKPCDSVFGLARNRCRSARTHNWCWSHSQAASLPRGGQHPPRFSERTRQKGERKHRRCVSRDCLSIPIVDGVFSVCCPQGCR